MKKFHAYSYIHDSCFKVYYSVCLNHEFHFEVCLWSTVANSLVNRCWVLFIIHDIFTTISNVHSNVWFSVTIATHCSSVYTSSLVLRLPHSRFHIMNLGRTMVMSSRVCMVMNLKCDLKRVFCTYTTEQYLIMTLRDTYNNTLCHPPTLCRLGEQSCVVSTDEGLLCQQLDWNRDQGLTR